MKGALSAALILVLSACAGDREPAVTVSGKTVYHGMGMEEVEVRVSRWDGQGWAVHRSARSGYHGSFIVRLAPGRYRLEAETVLSSSRADDGTTIHGTAEVSVVRARIDQLLVELR